MVSRLAFRAAPVTISVPATSANLGPGFDSFGLALDFRDLLAAQILDEPGLDVQIAGEGADDLRTDAKHLVIRAMHRGFDEMGGRPRGLALRCANAIPQGRGLGSSAGAIVGGLVLARLMVLGGAERLDDQRLLELATEMEGHPDNVAAALHGGATLAWLTDKGVGSVALDVDPRIQATVFIPNVTVSTTKARKALPTHVPFADAVSNLSRSALLTQALAGHPELLWDATEDRMHQEYRRSVMPKSLALVSTLRADGHAAVISGAGPTVLVLHIEGFDASGYAGESFRAHQVALAREGAVALRD